MRAPAIEALIIQVLAFVVMVGIAFAVPAVSTVQLNVAEAALLQGGLAAAISRARSMAPWWPFILFAFPVAVISLLSLHLPPWIFLAAFLVLAALYWSTFRTQVPYFPSNAAVWDAVAELLPQGRPIRFVDIGSGFGGLVCALARRRPESMFSGIELAPLPWLASYLRALLGRSSACFSRGDYLDLDFASCDVVFAYLSPAAMPALWEKASAEMQPGALLLSYEFPVPGVAPDFMSRPGSAGRALYGWRF